MSMFDTHKPVGGGSNAFPDAEQLKFDTPGQRLEGEFLDISDRIAGSFGEYRLAVVETEDGSQWKILAGGVLLDKLERAGAVVGGKIGIQYDGKVDNKKKTAQYNDWTVVYAPPEGTVASGGVTTARPASSGRPSNRPF